ncbi:MAG: hypothetical protein ACJ77B_06115 [Chloroflexota bacterium]
MVELRWLRRLGPLLAALGAVTLIASVVAGANSPPGAACSRVAAAAADISAATAGDGPWFRIDPLLDATGTLRGQHLAIGHGSGVVESTDLAPESFAAGPFGDVVLVGSDDGRESTVRAVVGGSCRQVVSSGRDVIRSAVLSPDGTTLYEHRVDRRTRADLGIWSRPFAGGAASLALAPIADDERYGRTFSTELAWSDDGTALVVQSCGIASCRTRLLDPRTGATRSVGDANQGVLIGAAAGRLITFASCRGLPCAIESTDIATGAMTTIGEAAGEARVVDTTDGAVVVAEATADGETSVRAIDPVSGRGRTIPVARPGLRLVGTATVAGGGQGIPPGWVLLTSDARPAADGASVLVNVVDGSTVELPEVQR